MMLPTLPTPNSIWKAFTVLSLALLIAACDRQAPVQRGGDFFIGSIHWAQNLAQNDIDAWANDAELHQVIGNNIYVDGRLPIDRGSWSLVMWSPSLGVSRQFTVDFQANLSNTDAGAVTSAPGAYGPVPANYVNSTEIFANAGLPGGGVVPMTVFNLQTYDFVSVATWGIHNLRSGTGNAAGSGNHFVDAFGNFLRNEPE